MFIHGKQTPDRAWKFLVRKMFFQIDLAKKKYFPSSSFIIHPNNRNLYHTEKGSTNKSDFPRLVCKFFLIKILKIERVRVSECEIPNFPPHTLTYTHNITFKNKTMRKIVLNP